MQKPYLFFKPNKHQSNNHILSQIQVQNLQNFRNLLNVQLISIFSDHCQSCSCDAKNPELTAAIKYIKSISSLIKQILLKTKYKKYKKFIPNHLLWKIICRIMFHYMVKSLLTLSETIICGIINNFFCCPVHATS